MSYSVLETLYEPFLEITDLSVGARMAHSMVALETKSRSLEGSTAWREGEVEFLGEELDRPLSICVG